MPTLDFSLKRMCELVGRDLTIPQLEDDLQWIALDIEGIDLLLKWYPVPVVPFQWISVPSFLL